MIQILHSTVYPPQPAIFSFPAVREGRCDGTLHSLFKEKLLNSKIFQIYMTHFHEQVQLGLELAKLISSIMVQQL